MGEVHKVKNGEKITLYIEVENEQEGVYEQVIQVPTLGAPAKVAYRYKVVQASTPKEAAAAVAEIKDPKQIVVSAACRPKERVPGVYYELYTYGIVVAVVPPHLLPQFLQSLDC